MLLFCAALALLESCGSGTSVSINVQRPPEINTRQYRRIVVDPLEASSARRNDGSVLRSALIDRLLASRVFDAVSDTRSTTGDNSGTLILSGAVVSNSYSEQNAHSQQMVDRTVRRSGKKDTVLKDSVVHYYEVKGLLRLSAQLRLSDPVQNAIIWTTRYDIDKNATSTNLNAKPAPIYSQGLERDAINEAADRLAQSFLIRNERTSIKLLSDGDMPELETGNESAKNQLWQDAANSYHKALNTGAKSSNLHKALYNYACANMVIGNYETAELHFNKAILMSPDEVLYKNTLALCQRIKAEQELIKANVR